MATASAPGEPLERRVPGEARVLRVEVAAGGEVEDEGIAGLARDRDRLLPARRVLREDQPHLPPVHVAPVVAAVDVPDRRHRGGGLVGVDSQRGRGDEGEDGVVLVHAPGNGQLERYRDPGPLGRVSDQPPARLGPLLAARLAPPALAVALERDDAVTADRTVLRPLVTPGDPDHLRRAARRPGDDRIVGVGHHGERPVDRLQRLPPVTRERLVAHASLEVVAAQVEESDRLRPRRPRDRPEVGLVGLEHGVRRLARSLQRDDEARSHVRAVLVVGGGTQAAHRRGEERGRRALAVAARDERGRAPPCQEPQGIGVELERDRAADDTAVPALRQA